MSRAIEKDLRLATKWSNEQIKKEGAEFAKIRYFIETQTNKGKKIVDAFINGSLPFPVEKKSDQMFLSSVIMQLLYFRFRTDITKELFSSWHSDELIGKNQKMSDELYRQHADKAKYCHELQKSGVIEDIIELVLTLKLGDKYTVKRAIKIIKICRRVVGENLLKGKYIKSLRGFE